MTRVEQSHWWNKLLRVAARNVFWNYCGTATAMLLGFFVTPVLVNRLGHTDYALWILLGSVVGYFNLVDLGIRGSVGRNIALERAREQADNVRRVFTSSLAILSLIGVGVLLGTLALRFAFFILFDVPADSVGEVRTALLLVGTSLALSFPLKVFDGTLWAHERFDILNWIDIPVNLLRAALTLTLIDAEHGLVTLGWITLATTVVAAMTKAGFCWRENPALRFAPRYVSIETIRQLYNFGIWGFIMQGARQTRAQAAPIIIGSMLGVPVVTAFAVAKRLQDYANTAVVTGTGVFTPIATRLHAVDNADAQRTLFVVGGKVCTATALWFLGLFLCFGGPFLRLWVGPAFEHASVYLAILALGETMTLSQSITANMVLSKARHRPLAIFAVIETAVSIPLALALARPLGVAGVCLGIALPQMASSGIATMVHGCRVFGIRTADYLKRAVFPVALRAVVPALATWIAVQASQPASWKMLVLSVAAYSTSYVLIVGPAFVPYSRVPSMLLPRLRRRMGS